MPSFDVDASLFRIAAMFQSTEETRYYLNGVFIEPHPDGGVFLVTTDGHRMFVAHDKTGKIENGPAIVQIGKDQQKACKEARGDTNPRRLVAAGAKEPITVTAEGKPVSIQTGWLVEGKFPDWRRAMKGADGTGHLEAVDGKFLKSFADAGEALTGSPKIEFSHASKDGPAIIRFARAPHVVGVLMPLKWDGEKGWPAFLGFQPNPPPEPEAAEPESEAA